MFYFYTSNISFRNRNYCDQISTYILLGAFCFFWNRTGESMVFFRSIGESESENMHLARLWREGSPERQLVALSAELRRNGLLLKNTIDSPSPSKRITKKYTLNCY